MRGFTRSMWYERNSCLKPLSDTKEGCDCSEIASQNWKPGQWIVGILQGLRATSEAESIQESKWFPRVVSSEKGDLERRILVKRSCIIVEIVACLLQAFEKQSDQRRYVQNRS